jgi:LuxR family maltose regulon positive regulatory protein
MPLVRDRRLCLSDQSPVVVDTKAWFAWLAQATHFSYQPTTATYRLTLRKEKRRQRDYWYAYLKNDGKLHNAYVGRPEDVTADRLEQVGSHLIAKVIRHRQVRP